MIERLRAFLHGGTASAPEAEFSEGVGPEDLRIAACALLLEVAYADDYFSADERRHLRSLVRRHFGLKPEEAEELIALADDERRRRVDLWGFTALIRDHYSVGQKMVLAEAMWGLVLADGDLVGREDYIMRKLSGLLALKPGYLSEARKRHESARGKEAAPLAGPDANASPAGPDANASAAGPDANASPAGPNGASAAGPDANADAGSSPAHGSDPARGGAERRPA